MKTAISLPDELFDEAERYAKKHGLSRSELYQHALREFLVKRDGQAITEAINAVLDETPNDLDPVLNRLQWEAARKNPW